MTLTHFTSLAVRRSTDPPRERPGPYALHVECFTAGQARSRADRKGGTFIEPPGWIESVIVRVMNPGGMGRTEPGKAAINSAFRGLAESGPPGGRPDPGLRQGRLS